MDVMQIWDVERAYTHPHTPHPGADPTGAEPLWCVSQIHALSGAHTDHAFPHSALEWRVAEYGFDPDDVATILDVILYEPYIPDPDDPFAWQHDATRKVLEKTSGLPQCWTPGVSDQERREAHLARIAAVKQHRVRLESAPRALRADALAFVGSDRVPPEDPLAPIKQTVRLDPARIDGRRMAVSWLRANLDKPIAPTFGLKPPATFVGMQPSHIS